MSAISVRNVTRVFRSATPEQLADGLIWYQDAHTIASALSSAHGVSVPRVAGILAAFSPQRGWGPNVNAATRYIASGGKTGGHFAANLAKASAILHGAPIADTLNGLKTTAFYRCIMARGLSADVCIDRHAYDIATNTRNTDDTRAVTPKRYSACSDAYTKAAVILSRELGQPISGAQVQAVTWITWRARYWGAGAFNVKN